MYIRNIKNAKLTLFAFGMPPSCYQRGGNCFMQNSRAYYLVLYLSQEGISVIFILPLNLGLCNLPESQVSCLIFYHGERIHNPIIKPLYSDGSETPQNHIAPCKSWPIISPRRWKYQCFRVDYFWVIKG